MYSVSKKQVGINLGEADQFPEYEWTRRKILKVISAAGVGSAVFGRALSAQVAEITDEMIRQAEWITGMEFSDQERELMLQGVSRRLDQYAELREVPLDPEVPPALAFDPAPWAGNAARGPNGVVEISESAARRRPDSSEDLAFATVTELAALVRTRQVSSVELTRLYLDRLRRYDPVLHCVITYTDELALNQAEKADREIAAGRYRGPLHGIPWGAKDNLAVPGYRTTWGTMPYKDQVLSQKATVATRLEEAGAVLVAKLSKGPFGGDVWFGGTTRNPWNPERPSGGSSAGSAAATAAGAGGVLHRERGPGQHRLPEPQLRSHRLAADLRTSEPIRNGAGWLEHAQGRPYRPVGRGLRARFPRYPRRRRARPERSGPPVPLAPATGRAVAASGVHRVALRVGPYRVL